MFTKTYNRGETMKHQDGIGTIINRFEQEEEKQNIETFNRLFFNCKLNGFDPDLTVTIGDYNKGRRTVKIGDTMELEHEFSLIDLTMSLNRLKPFILRYPNGDFIGRFNSILEASEHLDIAYATFRNYLAKSHYVLEELTHG